MLITNILGGSVPGVVVVPNVPLITAAVAQAAVDAATIPASQSGNGVQSSKPLVFQGGTYSLEHPVHFWNNGTAAMGISQGATYVNAGSYVGEIFHQDAHRGPLYLNIGGFAGGNMMICDPTNSPQKWLELSEMGAGVNVNGWAAIEIDVGVQKLNNSSYSATAAFLSSGGSRYTDDAGAAVNDTTVQSAFLCSLMSHTDTPADGIFWQVTTLVGGVPTFTFLEAPASSVTADGLVHHVKYNYDGSNLRIIVDNVVVASTACTGALVQQKWEMVSLGNGWLAQYNQSAVTQTCPVALAWVIVRDTVTQTTSGTLTLPTVKPTYPPVDQHISYQNNFDDWLQPLSILTVTNASDTSPIVITTSAPHGLTNALPYPVTVQDVGGNTAANGFWAPTVIDAFRFSIPVNGSAPYTSGGHVFIGGGFSKCYSRNLYSGGSLFPTYNPVYRDDITHTHAAAQQITDMTISNPYGPVCISTIGINNLYERLNIASKGGIYCRSNCFEATLSKIVFNCNATAADRRPAIYMGVADYMARVIDCFVSFYDVAVVALFCDLTISGGYMAACRQPMLGYAMNNLLWDGMTSISDEASVPGASDNMISLIGCANAMLSEIQISNSLNSVHALVIDQVNAGTGSSNVKVDGCLWQTAAGPDAASRTVGGYIKVKKGHANALSGGLTVSSYTRNQVTTPWIDNASDGATAATGFFPVRIDPDSTLNTRTISLAGLTSYTMTRDDHLAHAVKFTGALTGDCNVTTFALNLGIRYYSNATTGGHNVIVTAAGGTNALTIAVAPSATPVRTDGVDVRSP